MMEKTKRIFWYLVAFALLLCGIFALVAGKPEVASAEEAPVVAKKYKPSNGDEVSLVIETAQTRFESDEQLEVVYRLDKAGTIVSVTYQQLGFAFVQPVANGDSVTVYATLADDTADAEVKITATLSDGKQVDCMLYAVQTDQGIFISNATADTAYENYLDYALSNEVLTDYECEAYASKRYSKGVDVESYIIPKANGGSDINRHMKGNILWKDDDGNEHPLRRVRLDMLLRYNAWADIISTVTTDDNGYFECVSENSNPQDKGWNYTIRFYAGDTNVLVRKNLTTYTFMPDAVQDIKPGDTVVYKIIVDMSTDFGRACQISQALITARDFAQEMMGKQPKDLSLKYPASVEMAYYAVNTIYLPAVDDAMPSYAAWDVIMHEYGHHIAGIMDIDHGYLIYNHGFNSDLISDYGKKKGCRIAWEEAWATVFALVAQRHYEEIQPNIRTTCDAAYDDYDLKIGYSLETPNIEYANGEAGEFAIAAVLWDLYDDTPRESQDEIALGAEVFWDITTSNSVKTFSEFVANFYAKYSEYTYSLGEILSHYKIAPMENFHYLASDGVIAFRESHVGTEVDMKYSYKIEVYVDELVESKIFEKNNVTSLEKPFTASEWDEIRKAHGTLYIRTTTTSNLSPVTGPYIMGLYKFTNPAPLIITREVMLNERHSHKGRYFEYIFDLGRAEVADFTLEFPDYASLTVQTFGPNDTYMELYDWNDALVRSDDNSGYNYNALIDTVLYIRKQYVLRVGFKSRLFSGKIKLAVVKYCGPSTYESITKLDITYGSGRHYDGVIKYYDVAMFTFTAGLRNKHSFEFTFTPDKSGVSADFYVYIIDPRSVEPVNALLTKPSTYSNQNFERDFDLQTTYFVVLSPQTPGTLGTFSLDINRL